MYRKAVKLRQIKFIVKIVLVSQKVLISDDSSFWHQGAAYKFIQTVNPEILNDQEVLDFSNNSYSLVFSSSLRWNNLYIDSTGICFV